MEGLEADGVVAGGGPGLAAEHLHGAVGGGHLGAHPGPLLPVGQATPGYVACKDRKLLIKFKERMF